MFSVIIIYNANEWLYVILAPLLRRFCLVARAELSRSQTDMLELNKKLAVTEEDLESTRKSLADLKFRLMDAGMLEFLELPGSPERAYSLQVASSNDNHGDTNGYTHAKSVAGFAPSASVGGTSEPCGGQSILDKIQSFARKPTTSTGFGASGAGAGAGSAAGAGGFGNPFGNTPAVSNTTTAGDSTAWWWTNPGYSGWFHCTTRLFVRMCSGLLANFMSAVLRYLPFSFASHSVAHPVRGTQPNILSFIAFWS